MWQIIVLCLSDSVPQMCLLPKYSPYLSSTELKSEFVNRGDVFVSVLRAARKLISESAGMF
jgi:hypothetical protein